MTHGHTMCSKITFDAAVAAIAASAFETSSLPVVLSMEMHCSAPQQARTHRTHPRGVHTRGPDAFYPKQSEQRPPSRNDGTILQVVQMRAHMLCDGVM